MCKQEFVLNLMKKQCTKAEQKELSFAYREAAVEDYKELKKDVEGIKADMAEVKSMLAKQASFVANFKSLISNKIVIIAMLLCLAYVFGEDRFRAVASIINPM